MPGRTNFREIDAMRNLFIVTFLANVMLSLVSLVILPDRVAIHFGSGGVPDGWASKQTNTLLMLGVHILVFCALYFSPRLICAVPSKWGSLPNRDFWLSPQRRHLAAEKLTLLVWQFGTAVFLFMLFACLLTIRANRSDPVRLDESLLLTGLVIFLAYTVYWIVALVRAFRVPRAPRRGSGDS
jgi:uncharacterized membrane protein